MGSKNTKRTQDIAQPVYYGSWQILVKVSRVKCPDGRRRVATPTRIAGEADTAYTVPARITVFDREKKKNVAVSGSLSKATDSGEVADWEFTPYSYRRNGDIFERNAAALEAEQAEQPRRGRPYARPTRGSGRTRRNRTNRSTRISKARATATSKKG